jgi:hypothetical protein
VPYTSIQSSRELAGVPPPARRSVTPIASTLETSGFSTGGPSTMRVMSRVRQVRSAIAKPRSRQSFDAPSAARIRARAAGAGAVRSAVQEAAGSQAPAVKVL